METGRKGQASLIEKADSYIWDTGPQSAFLAGYTKSHLNGDVAPDMKKALFFTRRDFGVGWMNQDHGPDVKLIDKPGRYECDGLFSRREGLLLVVRTADCMPLILYSQDEGAAGVIHMGWRSAHKGILDNIGFDLSSFICVAGVGLRKCCYEVGEEFLKFDGMKYFVEKREGSYYFDSIGFARSRLSARGLDEDNFFDQGECSYCSARGFHSFRRTKARGRTLSFVMKY